MMYNMYNPYSYYNPYGSFPMQLPQPTGKKPKKNFLEDEESGLLSQLNNKL